MKTSSLIRLASLAALLLSACGVVSQAPLPTATARVRPTQTPANQVPTTPPIEPELGLTLWLPKQFAPDPSTPGGLVLGRQLDEFREAHPELTIDIRVKQDSGRAGLLDYLNTASAAAPEALPDLIALSQDDLRRAVQAGLVRPLNDVYPELTTPEWYDYAVDISTVDGVYAGVPFAGDASVLAYNVSYFGSPPHTWDAILTSPGPFFFPAADPSGLFTVAQYTALGGTLRDEAGQIRLDADRLTQVLQFYRQGVDLTVIPPDLPYASPLDTWRAYREARAIATVVTASAYLAERRFLNITAISLLPTKDGAPVALATAWSWALVTADPERQSRALQLLDWLTEAQRLGEWGYAAGVLPTRSSALRAWPSDPSTALASGVVSVAQLAPESDVLAVVGPPVQTAVQDVLAGRATPEDAALAASMAVANQ